MTTKAPRSVPDIVVPPPGPRSAELLRRIERVAYPGLAHGFAPFIMRRKWGHAIEDVDGNVYLDMISAMASVPLGACREDLIGPAVEEADRGGVHVRGEHRPAPLPLRCAGQHVGRPGHTGGALHVGADQDLHGGPRYAPRAGEAMNPLAGRARTGPAARPSAAPWPRRRAPEQTSARRR
jgi:hypothetical protein